jgi:hypothetical protein
MRVLRRETRQVPGRGPGERVDRLPRVTDDAHVVPVTGPHVKQQLLQRVDVLELVHHEVAVPVGQLGRRGPVLGEDGGGELQHGLEVHQVPLPARPLVPGVQAGHGFRVQRRGPPRGGGGRGIVARPHLGDLGPLDLAGGVAQLRQARGHPQLACQLGEQAQLGIQHGRRPAPHGARPEVAELAQRRRVERPGLHLVHAATGGPGELAQPPPQLTRRPGGEGDGEHVTRVHHADPHPVGDPVRDRPGLAGPGTSQHADGSPGGQRDLPLLGVERGEHGLGAVSIRAVRLHRTS